MRQVGRNNIILGLVLAGVGVLLSLGSYEAAKADGGGTYFVFWGVVVYGLYRAFLGARMYFASSSYGQHRLPQYHPAQTRSAPPTPIIGTAPRTTTPNLTKARLPAASSRRDPGELLPAPPKAHRKGLGDYWALGPKE
jgi:hypothetical protein